MAREHDHPYEITRETAQGTVSRGCTRYLGDALIFIRAAIILETNPCLWRVRNVETDRLCFRARYHNGKVDYEQ